MRFLKRLLCGALALAVLLCSLTACGKSYSEERQELHDELYGAINIPTASAADVSIYDATTSNFNLPYSRTDSLNPYKCTSTLNETVSSLIFDKLFVFDSSLEIIPVMAKEIRQDGLKVTILLRSGLVFSDGTPVTVDDIRYSFYAAQKSTTKYKSQLACFKGCSSKGQEVTFSLSKANPLAYRRLDIPIIKRGSDSQGMPTGSGRYVYVNDGDKGIFLERNDKWYNPDKPLIERISLSAMPTIESIVHSIEIGTVSYFYTDLRDGYPSRISANFSTVDINNLVYLGMNTNDPRLSSQKVRSAITLALDREEISTKAFGGRAYPATGPLTTSWAPAAEAQYGSTLALYSQAEGELNNAGFVNLDENSLRYDGSGRHLNFSILVSSDNELHMNAAQAVSDQLSELGISCVIYSVEFKELQKRISSGSYELYVAEYAMSNDMDFSALFTPNSGLYTGPNPALTIEAYTRFLTGKGTLAELIAAYDEEIPFIPLCFRLGMACYSRAMTSTVDISESDPFLGMQHWEPVLAEEEENGTVSSEE